MSLRRCPGALIQHAADRASEEKTIRDRLNEAIQERWVAEEQLQKMQEAAEKVRSQHFACYQR